ncbi:DUF2513 domain-containing protein [Cetobacterium somerae]|uniref:DUF2513 domain-containing protein n=1 Tax=Cetobacterium somerae TaxID=188913 RepID=UPI00211F2E8B|nr:DUF2513 domain-containing protein [Cetobacterium somerae]MCQ9627549.1 DUF2513 domain-containing protein [Cetobacterium somerae]
MKMNPDLIRKILLLTEENTSYGEEYEFEDEALPIELENYSLDEIFYHVELCKKFDFLECFIYPHCIVLEDLTPQGHLFLSDIRDDLVWNKTKNIASKIGSFSITTLKEIAVQVVSQSINTFFNPK